MNSTTSMQNRPTISSSVKRRTTRSQKSKLHPIKHATETMRLHYHKGTTQPSLPKLPQDHHDRSIVFISTNIFLHQHFPAIIPSVQLQHILSISHVSYPTSIIPSQVPTGHDHRLLLPHHPICIHPLLSASERCPSDLPFPKLLYLS